MNATPRQLFALYCATKINTKGMDINKETASMLIQRSKNGEDISDILLGYGGVKNETAPKVDYQKIVDEAHKRGYEAATKHKPQPMIVVGHSNPLDDNSAITDQYYVESGICGFSQIRLKLNNAFGKWLVKNNIAQKSCMGGCYIYVGFFGQSYEKKDKYSREYAKVLKEHGFDCVVESRID
jgi:hypothetical protein